MSLSLGHATMKWTSTLPLVSSLLSTILVTAVTLHQLMQQDSSLLLTDQHNSNSSSSLRTKRSQPTTTCNSSTLTEGQSVYSATQQPNHIVWLCKTGQWIPYQLSPAIGTVQSLPAQSCNQVKQQLIDNCNNPPISEVYWINGMRVYCVMSLDGGGWTLVWKNSFMDNLPLSDNMRYYSGYYKPCTSITDRGWCNIPKKADKFSPKEQMIVAYHNTHVVYAYKGLFNRNIDYDWSGGILLDFKKIVDKRTIHNGIQPAPAVDRIPGITFDKYTAYNYYANCDTLTGSLTGPGECRWYDCYLPSSISTVKRSVQMTMAIFVR